MVRDGNIEAIGKLADLQQVYQNIEHIPCSGVFMPPLVNAHIHLELSHMSHVPRPSPGQKMTDWIEALLILREGEQKDHVLACMQGVIREQYDSGCILLADIGNRLDREGVTKEGRPEILSLLEFLGPTRQAVQHALSVLKPLDTQNAVTAHAPYSTTGELISHLKKISLSTQTLFSIHVAESGDEIEFLSQGTGSFRDFLEKRGAWDGSFPFEKRGEKGAAYYLDKLGVLDSRTLCVHCVHLTEEEIRLLAGRKASVCLCPGSNRYLRVGSAPLEEMLKYDLLPAIGTDSLASNENLDMWREMQLLVEEHPRVAPSTILAMATLGGARALLREDEFGTLAPRKCAYFLNIDDPKLKDIHNGDELLRVLAVSGRPEKVQWVHHPEVID